MLMIVFIVKSHIFLSYHLKPQRSSSYRVNRKSIDRSTEREKTSGEETPTSVHVLTCKEEGVHRVEGVFCFRCSSYKFY